MKVKCIEITGDNLPDSYLTYNGWSKDLEFNELTLNKEYIVYAIFLISDYPYYLVCSDYYDGKGYSYPQFLPSCLFEIIDQTPSKYWIKRSGNSIFEDDNNIGDLGFPDIIKNKYFYCNIVEGYTKEVNIFKHWKHLIDTEYCDFFFTLKNNSNSNIRFYVDTESSLENLENLSVEDLTLLKKNKEYKVSFWTELLRDNTNLKILFFKESIFRIHTWKEIQEKRLFEKRVLLTIEEINMLDNILIYN